MAQLDLIPAGLIPGEARRAFARGDERAALRELRRARDAQTASSPAWAYLERVTGLLLIHTLREVEGTFALERADPLLTGANWTLPGLDVLLEDRS